MISQLAVGQKASVTRGFSLSDVKAFFDLSAGLPANDANGATLAYPQIGRVPVQPALTAALLSHLVSSRLPGPGTTELGQMLKFLLPIYVGQEVTATVEVSRLSPHWGIVTLKATVMADAQIVVDGEMVVMVGGRRMSAG